MSSHERALFDIDAAGYLVEMSAVFVEQCSCATPMGSRPAFQRALRRLQAGDTFITTKLWGLGNTIGEVISTLGHLESRQVSVVCLDYGNEDIGAGHGGAFLRALQLAQDLERFTRQIRAREAVSAARERGVAQGRPSSLSRAQQLEALKELKAGASVAEVARSLNTSRQTIMRLRDAHRDSTPDDLSAELDELAVDSPQGITSER
ncbi:MULTISPECIES: recombinase family protein [unclassified Caballeronia]|uniref:recombinase family protein n=1 Tax=unclassified Caballeronia TaxID=2646786 RepID=UPI002861FD86|nr:MULTISPECIES: recombinase family protein [unclassified Caballeronia]MDR5741476.1 recombinase family protein [Caballeronia sp. LZ016]MDR5806789.1 recombinase family protein [Caballeronia sp. LZ019]